MAKILIIGGGFGGLITAEKLSRSLDLESTHQITLVSPSNKFTFYPALVQLAFGEYEPSDITFDLADKLNYLGIRFVQGKLTKVNPAKREVTVLGDDFDGTLEYDYLVIATGRRLAIEKIPGFFENAHHFLGVTAALKFGEAVKYFKSGTIIVGMCPDARLPVPVCETAFALARKFENELKDGKIQIKVIFPESLSAAFGGANLHKELETAFERHHINVLYEIPISEITPNEILSTKKHRIKYDLLMLVPPFKGHAVLRSTGATNDYDYLKVDDMMSVKGLENTYAVGDIVAFSGPKFAHMAVRQASVAAENILTEISGKEAFAQYYHEINTIIDEGGANSIHLHYGVWDDTVFSLKKGTFWSWAKDIHDRFWQAKHS